MVPQEDTFLIAERRTGLNDNGNWHPTYQGADNIARTEPVWSDERHDLFEGGNEWVAAYDRAYYNAGIRSVQREDGSFLVTSKNIRMEVQSLGAEFDRMFAGKSDAQIAGMINQWLDRKDADDRLAYGLSTREIRQQAREDGYYGSEQHLLWAHAASARTGGRIPPEFWMRIDPYGGTAGNGPNILIGGGEGGPLTSIGLAHDTDWSLGRLMGVGPLKGLYDLDPQLPYQAARMGAIGLLGPGTARNLNPAPGPGSGAWWTREHRETDNKIRQLLDETPSYVGDSRVPTLNQGHQGWSVAFERVFAKYDRVGLDIDLEELGLGNGVVSIGPRTVPQDLLWNERDRTRERRRNQSHDDVSAYVRRYAPGNPRIPPGPANPRRP